MQLLGLIGTLSMAGAGLAATFTSCSETQIDTLTLAMDRATERSYAAIRHLEDNPNGSDIQTTWYGAFDRSRYNRILTAFKVRHSLHIFPQAKRMATVTTLDGR